MATCMSMHCNIKLHRLAIPQVTCSSGNRQTAPTPFNAHRRGQPSIAVISLLGFHLQDYTETNLCVKVSDIARLSLVVAGKS